MSKHFLLVALLLTGAGHALAQKQANVWYFGRRAGIDFNTGAAVALTDGQLNTRKGSASIADANTGALLFYTDGQRVYNRSHALMPNGSALAGDPASTQSAVIVPSPGNGQRFYVFTTGQKGAGMGYSEVDMGLAGGLGDVVAATKNTVLLANSSEKLIATRHANGTDFWIITHEADNARFVVYPVTAAGVGAATTTAIGSSLIGTSGETGFLRVSPDGTRLANAVNSTLQRVELLAFNRTTGAITGPPVVLVNLSAAYGIEFSPNGELLYLSEQLRTASPFSGNSRVIQFNLAAGGTAAINASRTILTTSTSLSYGALQMAPDGRVYVARENGFDVGVNAIGVITQPTVLGAGAGYVENGFDLGGSQTLIGLPTFAEAIDLPFTFQGQCLGQPTRFSVFNRFNLRSVRWEFGENGATSTDLDATHQYRTAGSFAVKLVLTFNDNTTRERTGRVIIAALPRVNLGGDTTVCSVKSLMLRPFGSAPAPTSVRYRWQDGSTNPTFDATQTGAYWVEVSLGTCVARDTVRVGFLSAATINLGKDTTLCAGTLLTLSPRTPGATIRWQDGSTRPTFRVAVAGRYSVEVSSGSCVLRDTIEVNYVPSPFFSFGADTSVCAGRTLTLSALNASVPGATYRWQDGSTDPTLAVSQAGTYWAEATLGVCTARDTVRVYFPTEPPVVDLGPDTVFSSRAAPIVLRATSPGATYRWQDGSTDPTHTVSQAGVVWVRVTNGCGTTTDSLVVRGPACSEFRIPNVITPNGDGKNDVFVAVCDDLRYTLEIIDRWGRVLVRDPYYQNNWGAEGLPPGVYFYHLTDNITRQAKQGVVTVLREYGR